MENENLIKKEVDVKGITVECVQTEDKKIWVVLSSLCKGLGVATNAQTERIKRDKDLLFKGVRVLRIPSNGGEQNSNCLELSFLPFFLTGIKSKMCKKEIRNNLVDFKLKAKDILAEAFLGKNNEKSQEFFDKLGLTMSIENIIKEYTAPLYDRIEEQGKVIYLSNNKINKLQSQVTNIEDNITFKQNINPRYLFEFYTAQYFAGQNKSLYVRGFYDDLANCI